MYGVRLPHGHFDSLTVRQCREQISANISYMECHSMIISNWQINHLNTGLNVWSPTPTWTPTDFRRRALRCLHTIDGAGVLVLLVCWCTLDCADMLVCLYCIIYHTSSRD